jgi:predicted SprT family Zn-dependent metalloprotease
MSDKPENFRLVVDEASQHAGYEPCPEVSFVVEKENAENHRYVCGHCGALLSHHGTEKVLNCVFLCPQCNAINDAPT